MSVNNVYDNKYINYCLNNTNYLLKAMVTTIQLTIWFDGRSTGFWLSKVTLT